MSIREIGVIWSSRGEVPLASNVKDRETCKSLTEAIEKIDRGLEDGAYKDKQPWLRAGTGGGSAILDLHGIRIIKAALEEGAASKTKVP